MNAMGKTMILYRGSLKSCNYHCSYCPFSKHRGTEGEYGKDRRQWERFAESLAERAERGLGPGALMIVPYGEALIHSWYWEGLGRLSALDGMEALGAQTNLSFPVERFLDVYRKAGGKKEKLRLWATFHPEMTEAESFAETCKHLLEKGVSLCAGAVGVPGNLPEIRRLREMLPEDIYLWINKMDGLRRPYTREEREAFEEIDPFFKRELVPVKAEPDRCRGRIFVEGDGKVHSCNISPVRKENWYDWFLRQEGCSGNEAMSSTDETMGSGNEAVCFPGEPVCSRKLCSCYLAYGGRSDVTSRLLFGEYPLFRIPRTVKAVFLDIDGTLVLKRRGESGSGRHRSRKSTGEISELTKVDLEILKGRGTSLFFATGLPYEAALKRCREIRHLFDGGVFGGGGYVTWKGKEEIKEKLYPIKEEWCRSLKKLGRNLGCRVLLYRREGEVYKITFLRPEGKDWKEEEARQAAAWCRYQCENQIRVFAENHCLEMVAAGADKAEGVKLLCGWLNISPADALAAGDSAEDEEMAEMCGNKAGGDRNVY